MHEQHFSARHEGRCDIGRDTLQNEPIEIEAEIPRIDHAAILLSKILRADRSPRRFSHPVTFRAANASLPIRAAERTASLFPRRSIVLFGLR